jgi:hypothetical protein
MTIEVVKERPLIVTASDEDLEDVDNVDAGTAFTLFLHSKTGEFPRERLGEHMEVISSTMNPRAERARRDLFEYVDLREVDDLFGQVLDFKRSRGSEIGSTKHRFQRNDILFAKIMPSLENKKVALVTQEVTNGVASTEFIVLRRRQSSPLDVYFLFRSVRSDFFTQQAVANTTGATGRQRLAPTRLLELVISVPPAEVRAPISAAVKEEFQLRALAFEQSKAATEVAAGIIGPTTLKTMRPGRKAAQRGRSRD